MKTFRAKLDQVNLYVKNQNEGSMPWLWGKFYTPQSNALIPEYEFDKVFSNQIALNEQRVSAEKHALEKDLTERVTAMLDEYKANVLETRFKEVEETVMGEVRRMDEDLKCLR